MRNVNDLRISFSFILFWAVSFCLQAQNANLKVAFKDAASAPRNLNVCGVPVNLTININSDGLSASARTNISATLKLFKGIEFVQLNSVGTTPGVILLDGSDVTKPVFQLPDVSPNGANGVTISYSIKANCAYTDTLTNNNYIVVHDAWDFTYDLGAAKGLKESDFSTEYHDAIKVPFFTRY